MSETYRNTGKTRATILSIHKIGESGDLPGWPMTFDLKSAFGREVALTEAEIRKLGEVQYGWRCDALVEHVRSILGYTATTDGTITTNTTTCPIGDVTL